MNRVACAILLLVGCRPSTPTLPAPAANPSAPPPAPPAVETAAPSATEPAAREAAPAAPVHPLARDAPRLAVAQVGAVLFPAGETAPFCDAGEDAARIACLFAARYASDARAERLATDLYAATGDVAGVLAPEVMEGGFRGKLHLVPAVPAGKYRTHLAWAASAMRDYDAFFAELGEGVNGPPRYVWRGLSFRFMRSVGARTPSAYALDWTIAYNVDGSLTKSAEAVRELLFHENFHLNDQEHGDWSTHAFRASYDAILARCGTSLRCLAPYTPTDMTVIGGTYYAFQPNNGDGVHEYAAELALRYYREQRAVLHGLAAPKLFKCGSPENATNWRLLVDEFFGGIDRTPPCDVRGGSGQP